MSEIKLARADMELQQAWLEKHRDATEIIYHIETGLPKEARYHNPVYTVHAEQQQFWQLVCERMRGRTE